jgi:GTPase SAR1 family protein
MYYKDSHVAIIVYDITNKHSFEVLRKWLEELDEFGPKRLLIALVGNKIDLVE